MFNKYFQQELSYLKELGAEYAEAHPALAPMLSGPSSDPDVERLLEGVAFLTGQIREKLDDEFPEIIHELIQLVWPHYLRPVPSCSIITFQPKPALKQSLLVKAGVQVASLPVEGTVCLFKTCYETEVHPLELTGAEYIEPSGKPAAIRMTLQLKGLSLANWQPGKLRFYLAGNYGEAAANNLIFRRDVKRIVLRTADGGVLKMLEPGAIRPVGFAEDEGVIPYPSHSFQPYRIVQEYFIFPQKFLFFDLVGLDSFTYAGDETTFEILFELKKQPQTRPRIRTESIRLFATPVINLFPFEADPIRADHKQSEYLVRPASSNTRHYQVYSVEDVVGHVQGTAQERKYSHFNCFKNDGTNGLVYQLSLKKSPVRPGADSYLQVSYPRDEGLPVTEILSLKLVCTNGDLPENLRVGDISQATSSSPEFAGFTNIMQPTFGVYPPFGKNLLWRLLAHLNLNYVSLSSADNLKALLDIYLFPETRDRTGLLANKKRIDGIEQVTAKPANRLVSGLILRGQDISVKARSDHFAGEGDFYLFGCMLDEFFGLYSSLNAYSRFSLYDSFKGETYQWPARMGEHPLI